MQPPALPSFLSAGGDPRAEGCRRLGSVARSRQTSADEGGTMRAEIIAVGTEILLGDIQDTNSHYIATRLPALGIDL